MNSFTAIGGATTKATYLCGLLAVIVAGVSSGAMLTGATVLVPSWQSMSPSEFLAWFNGNAERMEFFFGPLQAATILLATASAILFGLGHRPGTRSFGIAAVSAITVLLTFPLYFRAANASFVSGTIPLDQVPSELARWATWQWVRTLLGIVAFATAMLAMARSRK
jgi:hypothetical protein